jgi:hypothetical protein
MQLTGKCKEDFEKWYLIEFEKRSLPYSQGFCLSDNSIQYGVYVDFFDSVGIRLECIYDSYSSNEWYVGINCVSQKGSFKLRTDARTEAIKKANEIYNN